MVVEFNIDFNTEPHIVIIVMRKKINMMMMANLKRTNVCFYCESKFIEIQSIYVFGFFDKKK